MQAAIFANDDKLMLMFTGTTKSASLFIHWLKLARLLFISLISLISVAKIERDTFTALANQT